MLQQNIRDKNNTIELERGKNNYPLQKGRSRRYQELQADQSPGP